MFVNADLYKIIWCNTFCRARPHLTARCTAMQFNNREMPCPTVHEHTFYFDSSIDQWEWVGIRIRFTWHTQTHTWHWTVIDKRVNMHTRSDSHLVRKTHIIHVPNTNSMNWWCERDRVRKGAVTNESGRKWVAAKVWANTLLTKISKKSFGISTAPIITCCRTYNIYIMNVSVLEHSNVRAATVFWIFLFVSSFPYSSFFHFFRWLQLFVELNVAK